MDSLPDEILLHIFSYLNMKDLVFSAQYVCRRWLRVSRDDALWQDKLYNPSDESEPEILVRLQKMPSLRAFHLHRRPTDVILETLSSCCKNLVELDISCLEISSYPTINYSTLYKLVVHCPNIEMLSIPDTLVTFDEFSNVIARWKKLTELEIVGAAKKPLSLRPIGDGCPSLKHIGLYSGYYRNEDLEYVLRKKRDTIVSVVLPWSVEEGKSTIPVLKVCCEKIEALKICDYREVMVQESLDTLVSLVHLKKLWMYGLENLSVQKLMPVFEGGSLSNLVMLDLSYYESLDDRLAQTICIKCPLLQQLSFHCSCLLTGEGLRFISSLKKLVFLDLYWCSGITDDGIVFVVECQTLRDLNIAGCVQLTEYSMQMLVTLHQLRSLILSGCTVKGLPFRSFPTHLPFLRKLDLKYCEEVDIEALNELELQMPNLSVERMV
ncbi:F-box/LRR-repeat protein fbxl-1-like [Schistocerca americana]|uniref:F-box/LRR-repeat protein fbxl-1-like n=1 Tax=Schistocerca americana TaxID=7009 RepID=UPI001F4F197B|nr:F-box/LRR-repeat protein fbxl-1-like [Schistocerca americana]XP_049961031.1 F-box/LRR-repeat protein fbxl-1-like [Schistocerca serialis cubense]